MIVNRSNGQEVRINVRSVANVKAIRKEKRNGRDVIIVPSATTPDGIVMNDIKYLKEEIESSYTTLERTPAPLGHPTINGKFVSARDPEGINIGWIGAWNENVRHEKGRVLLDKVIDVERANQSEGGRAVLAAIDAGNPIHTSTGLTCNLEAVSGDVDHKFIARNIVFDHDAILLNEEGAATPEDGVGMMVNSKGEEIEVINSSLTDSIEYEIDWAGQRLVEALERRRVASLWERIRSAVIEAIGSERETSTNTLENEMTVSKEQFDALSAKVDTLSESLSKVGETVGNAVATAIKPLVDAQQAVVNAQKAKDDAEKEELVGKIVKANLLDEASAKELTLNAARALAKKAEPGQAAPLNASFNGAAEQHPLFKLPKAEA